MEVEPTTDRPWVGSFHGLTVDVLLAFSLFILKLETIYEFPR